jgi:hypothetical protein
MSSPNYIPFGGFSFVKNYHFLTVKMLRSLFLLLFFYGISQSLYATTHFYQAPKTGVKTQKKNIKITKKTIKKKKVIIKKDTLSEIDPTQSNSPLFNN